MSSDSVDEGDILRHLDISAIVLHRIGKIIKSKDIFMELAWEISREVNKYDLNRMDSGAGIGAGINIDEFLGKIYKKIWRKFRLKYNLISRFLSSDFEVIDMRVTIE